MGGGVREQHDSYSHTTPWGHGRERRRKEAEQILPRYFYMDGVGVRKKATEL